MKFTEQTARTRTTWVPGIQHQRGEANNAAKLTGLDVARIRLSSLQNKKWADFLDVSEATIRRARNRQTWKHIA